MESGPTIKTRWERRKDARPQELLSAALDFFVEKGFAATRLEEVAKRAGVSKGTLYLYFSSKEDLFKAVVRENLLPLNGEAEKEFAHYEGSSANLFRRYMLSWWERIGNTKLSGISKLMIADAGNFPEIADFYHTEFIIPGNAMIRRLLERGMESGEFRRIDLDNATHLVAAPIVMLMLWKHFPNACQTPISPEHYVATFIDLYLNGLLNDKTAPLP